MNSKTPTSELQTRNRYRVLHVTAENYPTHEAFLTEVLAHRTNDYAPVFLMANANVETEQSPWEHVQVYTYPNIPRLRAVKWIRTYFFTDVRHIYMIPRIVVRHKVNIIQVRDLTFPLLLTLLLRPVFKCKVIYQKSHPHEYKKIADAKMNVGQQVFPKLFYGTRLLENRLLHWAMRRCDAVLPITQHMADNLHRDHDIPYSIMQPFGLGFSVTKATAVLRRGPIDGVLKMVYVGTLAKERELDIALQGLAVLRSKYPMLAFTFQIIGGTSADVGRLRKQSKRLDVDNHCVFHGRIARDQVYVELATCHVGVSWVGRHKRFADASPTKAYEYLAYGLPVLATDTVMEHKELADNTEAVVVCAVDPKDFAEHIVLLKNNYEWAKEKAIAARPYLEQHFSYENMRARLYSLYKNLLAK